MPTYEYKCTNCSLQFERQQSITENPITECPECFGRVQRLISGGIGFILEGSKPQVNDQREHNCQLERTGSTCCGRDERCQAPHCEENQ